MPKHFLYARDIIIWFLSTRFIIWCLLVHVGHDIINDGLMTNYEQTDLMTLVR